MTEAPIDSAQVRTDAAADGGGDAEREVVEHERAEIREFIAGLSADDIKSGDWFAKLSAQALSSYTDKVDWQYFQQRYAGVPADAIVDQRIKMAARYAAIEGGISAGAYTLAVATTIGSLGGASPATLPAAIATVMVDVAFITRLQLRLAHDIAVLYRVPLDLSDPEDMWKLYRVAFTIKGGEVAREGVLIAVPAVVRPVIKRFYSKGYCTPPKGSPSLGSISCSATSSRLASRRWACPLGGAEPLLDACRGAPRASCFPERGSRDRARRAPERGTRHPRLMLWVAWLVITADSKMTDAETLLMLHLVRLAREQHEVVDVQFADLVEIDPSDVWRLMDAEPGDLGDLLDLAERVAAVDDAVNSLEQAVISELRDRCYRA
ncbi:hypothetical protein ACFQZC_08935 [Streptacidiphilus monticola]